MDAFVNERLPVKLDAPVMVRLPPTAVLPFASTEKSDEPEEDAMLKRFPVCPATAESKRSGFVVDAEPFDMESG